MSAKTNAERQRAYRARRKAQADGGKRNATVTAAIPAAEAVTERTTGILYRNDHTYYANTEGKVYAVVCCQHPGCKLCGCAPAAK